MSVNAIGLEKKDYRGLASTLCSGCGHNSVTTALICALYEISIDPKEIIKLSGIGCSSKTTNYFLNQSFGFNSAHGRMAPLATGVHLAQPKAKLIGVSGDGDTASIGLGSFLHLIRRNVPIVYIVENNGVYGLTKGQFSSTCDKEDQLKGRNNHHLQNLDVLDLALSSGCEFIARAFSGRQIELKQILKLALAHNGSAVIDVISPCVAYGNEDQFSKSYKNTQEKSYPLHDIDVIAVGNAYGNTHENAYGNTHENAYGNAVSKEELKYSFKPVNEINYNNSNILEARQLLLKEKLEDTLHTGVLYINTKRKTLFESMNLDEQDSFSKLPSELKLKKEEFSKLVSLWSLELK